MLIKFLLSLSIFIMCDGASILVVFPLVSRSHYMVLRPFVEELAKRGHEVTVITANPAYPKGQTPANYTEIDIQNEAFTFRDSMLSLAKGHGIHHQVNQILNMLYEIFDRELKSEALQKLLGDKTKKFDLLILEACVRTTLALQHVYKAPVIQISSFGTLELNNYVLGSTSHPLLYPTLFHQKIYNLTLWEKLDELYNHYYAMYLDYYYEKLENEMLKKHFPDIPPLSELSNNVELLFLNVHPIWESNRPVPPNVVYLGGLHLHQQKEVPEDLKSYLDASKNGVIYMSFGTNVSPAQIPEQVVTTFLKVFAQLPYDVVWKWESGDIVGAPKNVKIGKWFPQIELLRHPKVKLFVTQGGLHSTEEAIDAGVPMIGIPMFGDQWFNVERHLYHKIGVRLDIANINEDNFKNAITTVIEDESYRNNILELRSIINDQPQSSLDRGIWWTEYILRHGSARLLRSPAANMPYAEYLLLDLVATILMALVLVSVALYSLIKVVANMLKKKDKVKLK
ncbi:UDP-glycosyltransferase UGT4 isoform X1 [Manduca sexta]|uniref:UDP-glycosyltransferase UGT4 isoform X1 n=1 Tax=Manduca sexta TaxID=7130 RepID=UPI00189048FC|nr:UDP-glycosyltransferase UGT4 isoform X1 [Manduca sexta]